MMNWKIGLLSLLCLHVAVGDDSDYKFTRKIAFEAGENRLVGVRLDQECYGKGFLRVVDDSGSTVPFVIRKIPTTKEAITSEQVDHEILSLSEEQNRLVIVCKTSKATDSFSIDTPLDDFEKTVRVEASPDGEEWTVLTPNALIYDYRKIADYRNTVVPMRGNESNFIRITIESASEHVETPYRRVSRSSAESEQRLVEIHEHIRNIPFRIDRIQFRRSGTKTTRSGFVKGEYPVSEIELIEDEDGFPVCEWDGSDIPVNEFSVVTDEKNFYRTAMLYGKSSGDGKWRFIKKTVISNFQLEGLSENNTRFSIPREYREDHYRLKISGQDVDPLEVEKITMSGLQYEAVWMAKSGRNYKACFSDIEVLPGSGKMVEVLLRKDIPVGQADWAEPLRENSNYEKATDQVHPLNDPRFLWLAVGGAVLTLALLLIAAVRKVDVVDTPEN